MAGKQGRLFGILDSVRISDAALALFVVLITAMLLIPLPSGLLDFLLVVNIAFSILLLLVSLYMPNALALLVFPSLLLLSTLFRLGLNVASTRLILSQGFAGDVIQAFGTFLIRGEVVVGVIIFLIITAVNFVVVASGAARVSEVAARFALDALPGKQMSIDAELRAGAITADEARRKREDLRKESQLYGAMDGAMKFVQGDVIAGIFIIVVNILGGLYMGVAGGLSFGDAIQTYTILTVGDGLVSQIPALMVSICAGIIVTRVSSGENTTLGSDVGTQLFSRPGALVFSGLMMLGVGLLPGLPVVPFWAMGICIVLLGYFLGRSRQSASDSTEVLELRESLAPALGYRSVPGALPEPLGAEGPVGGLTLYLDQDVLFRIYKLNEKKYADWWNEFRRDYHYHVGIRLGRLHVAGDSELAPATYRVAIEYSEIDKGSVILDSVMIESSPANAILLGCEAIEELTHPIDGKRVFIAQQSPALRNICSAAGIRTYDFLQLIALRIGVFYQTHPEEGIKVADVHDLLTKLEAEHPGLISEGLRVSVLNPGRFTSVLHELVRRRVPVRDFKQLVENVVSFGSRLSTADLMNGNFDEEELIRYIKGVGRRERLAGLLSFRGTLKSIFVGDEFERLLEDSAYGSENGEVALKPDDFTRMRKGLEDLLEPLQSKGLFPVSLLCGASYGAHLEKFLRQIQCAVQVVTFEELTPGVKVEQVAIWR